MNNSLIDRLGISQIGSYWFLLSLFWTQTTLVVFARGLFAKILGESIVPYFIPVCFIIAVIICLPRLIKSSRIIDYVFVGLTMFYFYKSYDLYPANAPYMLEVHNTFIFWALPMIFVGTAFKYREAKYLLYVLSILSIVLEFLYLLLNGVRTGNTGEAEEMGLAYGILPAVIYIVWIACENKRKKDLLLAFLAIIELCSLGTRGPLFVLVLFLGLFFLFFKKYDNPLRTRVFIILLLAIALFLLENIIEIFSSMVNALGFSTRIFDYFKAGDIGEMMGRDIIAENLWDAIQKGPFWGYGFCSDRIYSDFYECYAHNIALELMTQFGMIPGVIIITILVLLSALAIMKSPDYESRIFNIIMFMVGVGSLLFSGTYLKSMPFFFMIGVFLGTIRNSKPLNNK